MTDETTGPKVARGNSGLTTDGSPAEQTNCTVTSPVVSSAYYIDDEADAHREFNECWRAKEPTQAHVEKTLLYPIK